MSGVARGVSKYTPPVYKSNVKSVILTVKQRRQSLKIPKWTPQQKMLITLEGFKGKTVGQICSDHEICQSQYYKWRDTLLSKTHKAFEYEST